MIYMGSNLALQTTQLNDILFTEDEITANEADRTHIFELKNAATESLGFTLVSDLKTYAAMYEEDCETFLVRQIDSTEWSMIFEHPLFQRRRPQMVSPQPAIESDQEFYILKNGQKAGPLKKQELISMLDDKQLLLTDMVSYNAGYTWMKLFQLENFDRRVLKESEQLPGLPLEAMNHTNDQVINISPATEAISSLAYLSNVKRGKSIENNQTLATEANFKSESAGWHKWLFILSIMGVAYFLYNLKNELNSPFKDGAPAIGEQAEVLTPVEMPIKETNTRSRIGESNRENRVNDQRRSVDKFESRQMNPVVPRSKKSFMDSAQYQEINDTSAEDPNYFYDNSGAMELDPVRSKVSKENYDNQAQEAEGPIPTQDAVFENEVSN